MDAIARPKLLNPNRMLVNDCGNIEAGEFHRRRADVIERGLRQSCGYAQDLWNTLDELRHYLLDDFPPDSRVPGVDEMSARPSRPDHEDGRRAWMDADAAVHSVLAGPDGDSGYGRHQAAREAHWRRSAPRPMQRATDLDRIPRPVARGLSGALRSLSRVS